MIHSGPNRVFSYSHKLHRNRRCLLFPLWFCVDLIHLLILLRQPVQPAAAAAAEPAVTRGDPQPQVQHQTTPPCVLSCSSTTSSAQPAPPTPSSPAAPQRPARRKPPGQSQQPASPCRAPPGLVSSSQQHMVQSSAAPAPSAPNEIGHKPAETVSGRRRHHRHVQVSRV